ncbi:MAG TPA: HDIG domain-containing protein [Bacteroidia bacterium]|nr:HDIG domain-containing protein [Bacteroidia bacterium]
MNKIFSFLRDRHALIYKGFLFFMSLTVIVYLFPREFRFRYDLSEIKDKPWPHENLIAPFDFAIKKSPEEVAREKDEIRRNFIPYFRFDEKVPGKFLAQVKKNELQESDKEKFARIAKIVGEVYSEGIRSISNTAGKGPGDVVLIVSGRVAEEQVLDDFIDPAEADSIVTARIQPGDRQLWLEKFSEPLIPNIVYDSTINNRELAQQLGNISETRGALSSGQIIVTQGQLVTDEIYRTLQSLQEEMERQYQLSGNLSFVIGHILLVAFCLFSLFQFLRLFRSEILTNDARLLFVLLMIVLTVCMSYIPSFMENVAMMALPFCILPVIMRAFFDTRLALFTHLTSILIIAFSMPGDRFAFLFIQVLAGITAIFSIVNMRNRSQLFYSLIAILGCYVLLHISLYLLSEGDIRQINVSDFVNFAISAILLLLAYPLIFLFEKMFGFVSDVTLMELADSNNTLLRELAEKAPGTFQHSMQVANLAEEAIGKIGGNTLLTRAGALYHDIGKGDNAQYFIENQTTGINPHEELTFEESAAIIIRHVIRGVEKAKEAKLPEQVIDFIRTHHGTTNTAYFLTLYKKNNPEKMVDEELFRYPGPVPYSKETAVLMMADAVEASSRSLPKYDVESVDNLVEEIIDEQADQHQFNNADITLKDITAIKKIFKKKLRSIYHVRVEYPK